MPDEGSITLDELQGDITMENSNLDDYILVKSDGFALYHLAAMVDDHLMGITHVMQLRMAVHLPPARPYHPLWMGGPRWLHLSSS